MQLMPGTQRDLGVSADAFDPRQNVAAGVAYLRRLTDEFGTVLALAAYNAGPGAVRRYNGIPPYEQTHAIVPAVLGRGRPAADVQEPEQQNPSGDRAHAGSEADLAEGAPVELRLQDLSPYRPPLNEYSSSGDTTHQTRHIAGCGEHQSNQKISSRPESPGATREGASHAAAGGVFLGPRRPFSPIETDRSAALASSRASWAATPGPSSRPDRARRPRPPAAAHLLEPAGARTGRGGCGACPERRDRRPVRRPR